MEQVNYRQVLTYRLLMIAFITVQRQLSHDKTCFRSIGNTKYDFIVVGAGTAGSAVAMRLSEDKTINVLLLEAGGPQTFFNDIPGLFGYIPASGFNIWPYFNKQQKNAGLFFPGGLIPELKGKTLGGTSSINAMIFSRGNALGFDNWVKTYGAKGWSYAEVLPYFKKFENNLDSKIVSSNPGYHDKNGSLQITTTPNIAKIQMLLNQVYNGLGFSEVDLNGASQVGYAISQRFIGSNGLRSGAGTYIDPNPHPENLHIVCKALVVKILFNGLTAIGVEFIKNSKSYEVFADKEVVISAGPINSAQLLMLSGIGPKNHLAQFNIPLKADLPVGENYTINPGIIITFGIENSQSLPVPLLTFEQLSQLYFQQKGPLSGIPATALYFSTNSNPNKFWPNIYIGTLVGDGTLVQYLELLRPRSRGTICLESIDPLVSPIIDPNIYSDLQDFTDIVEGTVYMLYVLETTSIAKYVSFPSFALIGCPVCPNRRLYECREGIECLIKQITGSTAHIGGSCRMGPIENLDVVVDEYLRVKNVQNLRVCDSSIFPELPNANTMSASVMVGEKCAQIIKDFYKFY